jgi:peptidoglycan/LPS O-acetylase OafA/YrhL
MTLPQRLFLCSPFYLSFFIKKVFRSACYLQEKISYSVYLLHYPIGLKFMSLPFSIIHQQSSWTLFFAALFISMVSAYFFYKWIEVPAEKHASKFKYQQKILLKLPQLA